MGDCTVHCSWRNIEVTRKFRSGVSLHSHTNQSRETLKYLAVLGQRYSYMRKLMQRLEQRAAANHGMRVDYGLSYWTPPARPELAFDLESGQIEKLGLAPMVSLSDHDSIDASTMLQACRRGNDSPISVEWTVPYGPQAFHLGVHNLPRSRSSEWMQILASFTACPVETQLKEILAALHAEPEVLLIFNHPMWDLYRVGKDLHGRLVDEFLRDNRAWVHAIELNGLRDWNENQAALGLAEKWGIAVISGGDRHGMEPNANINLTNADSFDEFVHEIRYEKQSQILFMPQYARPWKHRILQSAIDAVSYYHDFPVGSQRWDERAYHPDADGILRPLAALWPDGTAPRTVRWGISFVQLMGRGVFSGGLRAALRGTAEPQLLLGEYKLSAAETTPASRVVGPTVSLSQNSLTQEPN